jgi:thiamine-monophosphate kinase
MQQLAREGLIIAASDTSDGLLGAIDNIARVSRCGFHLRLNADMLGSEILEAVKVRPVASPWNIFFAWGDWSVAAVVAADDLPDFEECCRKHAVPWITLGDATGGLGLSAELAGDPKVFGMTIVRNENFVSRGFNAGINGHLDYILGTPLLTPKDA